VSRALPLPFREDNPENSSVRSITSSVGVAAAGDVDLEDPRLGLGRGTFSSSSEEMTCVVGDRVLRRPSIDHTTMNPQVYFGQTDESNTANNAKWRIGPPQDASFYSPPHRTSLSTAPQ
jgi:hypothetical protein